MSSGMSPALPLSPIFDAPSVETIFFAGSNVSRHGVFFGIRDGGAGGLETFL